MTKYRPEMSAKHSRQVLVETVLILALTFVAQFLGPGIRTLFFFVPTVYFFGERWARHRSWAESGIRFRNIGRDLIATWPFILVVSFLIQFFVVWGCKTWLPAFLDHVMARLPLTLDQGIRYLPVLLIGTLWEEINYRALFQARLSLFIPVPIAIGIVSVVFGIGHWASGDEVLVLIDVLLVVVDSVFYGIIFARSRNVFVAWIAHFLANLSAIIFFIIL